MRYHYKPSSYLRVKTFVLFLAGSHPLLAALIWGTTFPCLTRLAGGSKSKLASQILGLPETMIELQP
jgi:hypothetical protein